MQLKSQTKSWILNILLLALSMQFGISAKAQVSLAQNSSVKPNANSKLNSPNVSSPQTSSIAPNKASPTQTSNSANSNSRQINSPAQNQNQQQDQQQEEVILKGEVHKFLPSGSPIKLKILSLPIRQDQLYMERWSYDGDFVPPQLGDKVTSELTSDVAVEGDLVLPKGTIFYGYVSQVIAPKRFGKDGRVILSFEGLKTPKGTFLKFEDASQSLNTKQMSKMQNTLRSSARVASYAVGGAAGGALAGVLLVAKVGTLALTQPQYIIATGAGIGLLAGVIASVAKKGKAGTLMPGDEIQINLERSMLLPVAEKTQTQKATEYAVPGLQIKVASRKTTLDSMGRHVLVMDIEVSNQTNQTLFANDFVLFAPYNRVIYPGGLSLESMRRDSSFSDSASLKQFPSGSSQKGQLAFEIDYPGFEHSLALKLRSTQAVIYQASVGNPADYFLQSRKSKIKERVFGKQSDPWN